MKIKNKHLGPRGVNTINGTVLIDPGQTLDLKVFEREREHLEATGWFDIDGDYEVNPDTTSSPGASNDEGDTKDMAKLRKQFDASYKAQGEELKAANEHITDLKAKVAAQADEIERLKKPADAPSLKAEHHGGGKFNVTEGEAVHLTGLSKADADAFNAMSAAEKAEYVKAEKAKA